MACGMRLKGHVMRIEHQMTWQDGVRMLFTFRLKMTGQTGPPWTTQSCMPRWVVVDNWKVFFEMRGTSPSLVLRLSKLLGYMGNSGLCSDEGRTHKQQFPVTGKRLFLPRRDALFTLLSRRGMGTFSSVVVEFLLTSYRQKFQHAGRGRFKSSLKINSLYFSYVKSCVLIYFRKRTNFGAIHAMLCGSTTNIFIIFIIFVKS